MITLIYPDKIVGITVRDNIFYFTYREYPAFLIKVEDIEKSKVTIATDNFAYKWETNKNLNVFQTKIGDTQVGFTSNNVELFDQSDETFDKSTGTFIPKDEYKAYGAQR